MDERLREVERLARSTIDALTEHIAVIDADGTIVTVNKAWRDFAVANNTSLPAASEGSNYLAIRDKAASDGDQDAAKVAALIRGVISGKTNQGQWGVREPRRDRPAVAFAEDQPLCRRWAGAGGSRPRRHYRAQVQRMAHQLSCYP